MRTLIVGDVHGCLEELEALLEEARLGPEDRLVGVGDLVGKGPDGAGVVRLFREGGHLSVLGNHDAKLVAWHAGERERPPSASHRAHAAAMSAEDHAWLAARPLTLELPEHETLVVHAGLVPGVPLEAQRREDLLLMRSIRPDGTPSTRVEDGVPWASRWEGPGRVVFGHDAVRGLQRWPRAIGLDTGCCYGGRLTGLLLPEGRILSCRARAAHAPTHPRPLRVCRLEELDRPRLLTVGRDAGGRPRELIVLRTERGEPRAYVNRCQHLPIPLDGGSREVLSGDRTHLACGTHGALYRLEDGLCVEGPCEGASLERAPVRVDAQGFVVLEP